MLAAGGLQLVIEFLVRFVLLFLPCMITVLEIVIVFKLRKLCSMWASSYSLGNTMKLDRLVISRYHK